jgi:hypothetical protein
VLVFALAVFFAQILTGPLETTLVPTTGGGVWTGLSLGLAFGFVLGLAFWFAFARRHDFPRRIRLKRWHELVRRDALGRGLVPGLIVGAGIEIAAWAAVGRLTGWLAAGPAAGLATALVFMFSGPGADDASSVVPIKSWRNDLAFGLETGLLVGVVLGVVMPSGDFGVGIGYQLGIGLAAGISAGIVFMLYSTRTVSASLAFAQLAVRWHTPPRLMRFLEDARQRNVLRIIGPVYQFRHARLQDHLAGQAYRSASQPEPLVAEGPNAP